MSATPAVIDSYRAMFELRDQALSRPEPGPLRRLRSEAMERFLALGFPTTRQEEWRHTNLAPLASMPFAYPSEMGTVEAGFLDRAAPMDQPRAVVAGGRFDAALCALDSLPEGVEIASLAEMIRTQPERVLPYLGSGAEFQQQALVALNTALFEDGFFVRVPNGMALEQTIHLIYVSLSHDKPWVTHPRSLVVAGSGSQVTIVEHYVGSPSGPAFTNAVTEIVAGAAATVEYVRLQLEPAETFHIATVQTVQDVDSRVALQDFTFGGRLARNDINAVLKGVGSEVALSGLYLAKDRQHVDIHSRIDHIAAHCTSTETYKGILDGQAHGVFNGRIVVHSDAQKTNAAQTNRNLMLSDRTLVNTNPQLEIYADDVRCTHGSTVGQIDEEALFYFLSRGIDRPTARALLIKGFAQEIVGAVKDAGLRDRIADLVADWLQDVMASGERS